MNVSVVLVPVATNVCINCCQFWLVGLTVEFVSLNGATPVIEIFTVLVVPKIPPPVVLPTKYDSR